MTFVLGFAPHQVRYHLGGRKRAVEVHEIVIGKDSLDWTVRMFTAEDVARAKADFRGAKEWAAAQTSRWKAVAWARSR